MPNSALPSDQPPRKAGPGVSVRLPFSELQKLRDAVVDANHVFVRLGTILRTLEGFLKTAEAEAARDHSEYVPAAHNGVEGDLLSEGDRSSSPVRGHVGDLVGRHVDVQA